MDLIIQRNRFHMDGVFGSLYNLDYLFLCHTLEHSYNLVTKIPPGEYECIRGIHHLKHGLIETFEVTDVPNHSGILFHPGNRQSDSEGCILLGLQIEDDELLNSRRAFQEFMKIQQKVDEFTLVIESIK